MIPKLKDLLEPAIGSRLIETDNDGHEWWLDGDGFWHCECDGIGVDWLWEEVVDEVGPESTSYVVRLPE